MIKFSYVPEEAEEGYRYSAIDSVDFVCDEDCDYEQLIRAFRQFSHAIGYGPETIKTYLGEE